MNVKCEKCQAGFSIDDSLIKETGSNVRCSKCKTVFKVYPHGDADEQHPKMTKELLEFSRDLASKKEKSFSDTSPVFKIIEDNDCPLYKIGDEFQLSDKIFLVPTGKAPCLILAKDVVGILGKIKSGEADNPDAEYKCTGCTGSIRFGYKKEDKPSVSEHDSKPGNYIDTVINLLISFSIFKNLTETEIKDIVSFLKLEKFDEDDIILRKGEPGRNLFIIVSGRVEVVSDDGMTIAFMGKGEVFGEMSLLSGDPVGATVKSVELSTLLYIGANDFKRILNEIPSLQLNFTRLLARRMAEINLARSEEFASGMTGKLSEMPPAELFQTLNVNQKTGVLTLKLPKESAYLSFREGELISAKYREKEGENAFFELLKKREGRFKFLPGLSPEEMEASEVGDFMHLLMEGLRKIDEDDKAFLKTIMPSLEDMKKKGN
ncbi:MAG: cyclic nucleotide-binding domain-containing protein, partial [Desulfobacteraceae bacterium]|nr:cyclic nucleotide-binding domain-containing protein [Desulfobacteraceae bacterium]